MTDFECACCHFVFPAHAHTDSTATLQLHLDLSTLAYTPALDISMSHYLCLCAACKAGRASTVEEANTYGQILDRAVLKLGAPGHARDASVCLKTYPDDMAVALSKLGYGTVEEVRTKHMVERALIPGHTHTCVEPECFPIETYGYCAKIAKALFGEPTTACTLTPAMMHTYPHSGAHALEMLGYGTHNEIEPSDMLNRFLREKVNWK